MTAADYKALEDRLGHHFKDAGLLARALTHSSHSGGDGSVRDLERLEFLGDRVLGLLTAEELWRRFPEYSEGDMAPRLNALVRKETCAKAAVFFEIGPLIKMSDHESNSGGRKKKAILGDVMEALLGALYIDGGLEAARLVYDRFWAPNLEDLSKLHRDAKTALQEWSQQKKLGTPVYKVLASEGPAHEPSFDVEVQVKGLATSQGTGRSKRAAQMEAARALLIREGIWSADD